MPELRLHIEGEKTEVYYVLNIENIEWKKFDSREAAEAIINAFAQLLILKERGKRLLYARFKPDGRLDFCNLDMGIQGPLRASQSGKVILVQQNGERSLPLIYRGASFFVGDETFIIEVHGEYEGAPLTDYEIYKIV